MKEMRGLTLVLLILLGCDTSDRTANGSVADVRLREAAYLDFSAAPTLPSEGGFAAWHEESRRAAFVDRQFPTEILLFSPGGEFERVVGGAGAGPGEFDRIEAFGFDRMGALWAISQGGTRATVHTPDGNLVRTLSLAQPVVKLHPLGEDRFLAVQAGSQGAEVALLFGDGSVEALPPVPALGLGAEAELVAVATDGADRFWIAPPHSFSVWAGTVDGAMAALDLPDAEWFGARYPDAFREEFGEMIDARGATVLALEYDPAADLLWITTGVPVQEPDAPAIREIFASGDATRYAELPAMLIDHVVVGVDPATGTRIAERRFDYRPLSLRSIRQYELAGSEGVSIVVPEAADPAEIARSAGPDDPHRDLPVNAACALPPEPVTVLDDGDALLRYWTFPVAAVHTGSVLPNDDGLRRYREALFAEGAVDRLPELDLPPARTAEEDEIWQDELHNNQLVYGGGAGTIEPLTCLDALLFAEQNRRVPQSERPTEFMASILLRGAPGSEEATVIFGAGSEIFPPREVYGLDLIADRVADGWRFHTALHNHTRQENGALGVPVPSTSDVRFSRSLAESHGLERVRVTNGFYTFDAPVAELTEMRAR